MGVQIFISSTYEDLQQEREAVVKSILEIGDIPVGMEMFSAADEDQWKLIKRQIEQSDYYIVIIAHRYGSLANLVSFTEMEYDYAVSVGVPVLGFIIDQEAEWPPNHIEADADKRNKLEAFKHKVKTRVVSFWKSSDILSGKVLASLSKQKNLNPRPGWVRANNLASSEALGELAGLSKEVARLSEENSLLRQRASDDAHFSLIDAMAEDSECQALIFMYETGKDLPKFSTYAYGYSGGGGGSGHLGGFRGNLENTGLVLSGGGGRLYRLTDEGRRFANWLIKKERKCDFFWTPFGGWGQALPGSYFEQMLAHIPNSQQPHTPLQPPVTAPAPAPAAIPS
jgi:hypothetical protein